jgi:carboxylate-amine ligase
MIAAGAIDDYTFCWWDVRPHSNIGTIELRALDSQTSLRYNTALAALTQCLVVKVLSENPRGPYNRELTIENKLRASRYGLNACFYNAERGISVSAKKAARALVDELRPISQDLGCENELLRVLWIVENGTGSQHQRRVYEKSGDFLEVVAFLIENTRQATVEASSETGEG